MTLKRLGAFLAAAAMVIAALLIRGALDDDGDSSDPGGTSSTDQPSGNDAFTLVCSSEFDAVCSALQSDPDNADKISVTIEPAGTTLDRLAKANDDQLPDVWLTVDPFPAMLDQTRDRTTTMGPATTSTSVIALTTPIITVIDAKASALSSACTGTSITTCAGDLAGQSWATIGDPNISGELKLGISDPATEGVGLLTFADGIAGLQGTTDIDSSKLSEPAIRDWVRHVVANAQTFPSEEALTTMISRPSKVDVAATTVAAAAASPSGDREPYQSLAVEPKFVVGATWAVLVDDANSVRSQIIAGLLDAGWTAADEATPAISASTFITLRALWKDTR